MKFINIGKIVNTHGIKGEVRIISNFEFKNRIFIKGFKLYIGKKKEEYTINTYRVHKIYDMVLFDGITSINEIEKYKGDFVYINEDDLILNDDEVLKEKLIGYTAIIDNKEIGKITEIFNTGASDIIRVNKDILIPYVKEFIEKIDKDSSKIYIKNVRGLL